MPSLNFYKIYIFFYISIFLFTVVNHRGFCHPIKITTWNIEWLLSSEDRQNFSIPKDVSLRKNQDFIKLNSLITQLDADIFALQEIDSLKTLSSIFPKDKYQFFITTDKIAQHTALAIKKDQFDTIVQTPDISRLSLKESNHDLRSGLEVSVSNRHRSFKILVIHLKSGCAQENSTNIKTTCPILNKQFSLLLEWIQTKIKNKEPFIILGDFNRIIASKDKFFETLSDLHLSLPTIKKATPCRGGNYFIDGFILSSEIKSWFKKDSLTVSVIHPSNKTLNLSDHCPVSIWLDIP